MTSPALVEVKGSCFSSWSPYDPLGSPQLQISAYSKTEFALQAFSV